MNPTSARTGDTGAEDPGNDPQSSGPDCWKTPLLSRTDTIIVSDVATLGAAAKGASLPAVHPMPYRDNVLFAIDHEIPVMRSGGHASVIGRDPQPGTNRQFDRAIFVKDYDPVLCR